MRTEVVARVAARRGAVEKRKEVVIRTTVVVRRKKSEMMTDRWGESGELDTRIEIPALTLIKVAGRHPESTPGW